jgi:SAM-dependent methyltransferase
LSKTMSEACEPPGAGRVCPACGSESGRERGSKQGFALASCTACATLYTSELPAPYDYDGYYGAHNLDVPAFVHRRHAQIVRGFAPYRRTGRLLDVGFGAGSVMEVARAAGWVAQGVEIAHEAVEHARSLGLEVFHGELAAARYPANHFDVAVAVEVLEHVPDPRALLLEIARVLRPGGLLWATTPHARGASARLLGTGWSLVAPPDHLQLFSRRGVKLLLRQSVRDSGGVARETHGRGGAQRPRRCCYQ